MARSGTPPCGVFYVTDSGFILPTIVSAVQLRSKVPTTEADIHVIAVDLDQAVFDRVKAHLALSHIELWAMDAATFTGFDLAEFNQTHVPYATLGRFFMLDRVPQRYDHILYLDGDTWIDGDPLPLIRYSPPPGRFAAAEGPSFYFRNDVTAYGRWTREYLQGLGLTVDDGYFNAGVFSVDYDTWKAIAKEAFDFFLANTQRCPYHDESALNAVCQHRRVRLSPEWNYNTPYRFWGVERAVRPQIYHFTGGPKPWAVRQFPWADQYDPYQKAFAALSDLGLTMKPESIGGWSKMRNRFQWLQLRTVMLPRLQNRQRDVADVIASSVALG